MAELVKKWHRLKGGSLAKSEKVIRMFLFKNCDTISLTQLQWSVIGKEGTTKCGGKRDKSFIRSIDSLQKDFMKKVVSHERYGEFYSKNKKYEHYYYRLSNRIKNLIVKETLFWTAFGSRGFYGFEDPLFFKKGLLISTINSYDYILKIFLSDSEKDELEKRGVNF